MHQPRCHQCHALPEPGARAASPRVSRWRPPATPASPPERQTSMAAGSCACSGRGAAKDGAGRPGVGTPPDRRKQEGWVLQSIKVAMKRSSWASGRPAVSDSVGHGRVNAIQITIHPPTKAAQPPPPRAAESWQQLLAAAGAPHPACARPARLRRNERSCSSMSRTALPAKRQVVAAGNSGLLAAAAGVLLHSPWEAG
jgi:hypothetical protein